MIRAVIILFGSALGVYAVLMFASQFAFADHQVERVWRASTFSNTVIDPGEQCAAFVQAENDKVTCNPTTDGCRFDYTGSLSDAPNVVGVGNPKSVAGLKCDVSNSYRRNGDTETIGPSAAEYYQQYERVKDHADEDERCELLQGTGFNVNTASDFASAGCYGGCSAVRAAGVGVCTGAALAAEFPELGGCVTPMEYSGGSCDVATAEQTQASSQQAIDEAFNLYEPHADPDPEVPEPTEYPAPSPPPDGLEPAATVTDNGITVEVYQMQGGGEIVVITDADGNIEFTDKRPISGTGQYALAGTTDGSGGGGSTDGDTGGGGVDGAGTSGDGSGTSGAGDGGAGTSGDCEGAECGEGDRELSGGDSCETEPTCSGDPINCGIAKQVWLNRCEAEQPSDQELIEAGELQEYSGENAVESNLYGESTDIFEAAGLGDDGFDDSGFLGSRRSCPQGPTFEAFGRSMSFDLDLLCEGSEVLGILILIGAAYGSVRIALGES